MLPIVGFMFFLQVPSWFVQLQRHRHVQNVSTNSAGIGVGGRRENIAWHMANINPRSFLDAPVYTVTVFLGVFRTNLAFQQYKAGRGHLGAMVTSLSNAMRFAVCINNTNGNSVDVDRVGTLVNVMAAMIRIDIREFKLPRGMKRAPRPGTNAFKQWKTMEKEIQF